jgi:hypothetical protein
LLQSICLPASVEVLGWGCFSYCPALSSFTFESGSRLNPLRGQHSGCVIHWHPLLFLLRLRVWDSTVSLDGVLWWRGKSPNCCWCMSLGMVDWCRREQTFKWSKRAGRIRSRPNERNFRTDVGSTRRMVLVRRDDCEDFAPVSECKLRFWMWSYPW